MSLILPRRHFLKSVAVGAGGLLLGACDRIAGHESVSSVLRMAEALTMGAQRAILSDAVPRPRVHRGGPLAGLPLERDVDAGQRGLCRASRRQVRELAPRSGWAGRKSRCRSLWQTSRLLPSRTQITRHDCVEGWSAIGKWTGVPLGLLLQTAGPLPSARYVVFHCADDLEATLDGSGRYYESIDLVDSFHPQTILAYALNGKDLPVENGAPLRLRVERQLGYKQAKYILRIEVVDSFASIGRGNGGFWEDRGYEWYAGI